MIIKEFAPAKLNLCLHVTGQRVDGYHLLDSLVAFADVGDHVVVEKSDTHATSLTVTGPMATGVPTDGSNLVYKAAALFPPHCATKITLHKTLPSAAGIGGGSADAAATLRAMARLWGLPLPGVDAQLSLGADVPICMDQTPKRMQGIGQDITAIPDMPNMAVVLANPMRPVPTGPVFHALTQKNNPPIMGDIPQHKTPAEFAGWLEKQRNDLQPPALQTCPIVGDVLAQLAHTAPLLARMSGSGGTCFALYETPDQATLAAQTIQSAQPGWWVRPGMLMR